MYKSERRKKEKRGGRGNIAVTNTYIGYIAYYTYLREEGRGIEGRRGEGRREKS